MAEAEEKKRQLEREAELFKKVKDWKFLKLKQHKIKYFYLLVSFC